MFDPSKITESDKKILVEFYYKRQLFDNYIEEKGLKLFTCPGCGYPTLSVRGAYDVCSVCDWEDDSQDDEDADKVWGGPNGYLSLTENRINIGKLLEKNVILLKGVINLDTDHVLKAIDFFDKRKKAIRDKMTGKENREHPIWAELKQVEKDLRIALCQTNGFEYKQD